MRLTIGPLEIIREEGQGDILTVDVLAANRLLSRQVLKLLLEGI